MFCSIQESELPAFALSIRQPWAHAIAMGWKDIENRKWNTTQHGLICIHASAYTKKNFEDDREDYLEVVHDHVKASPHSELSNIDESELSFGAIIGVARLVQVTRSHDSPWFFGPYGFVLAEQQIIQTPIKVKGALGFFDWRQRLIVSDPVTPLPAAPQPAQGSLF